MTLRGLLSMTGGVGVPGFIGYEPGAPLPTLTEILDGTPPANSPPVTVIAVPGSAYHYSGGGYEIAEALMQDVAGQPFVELMQELVLGPAGMSRSSFAQPIAPHLRAEAASGHDGDGTEFPGRWHVVPEHAAAGLWSTPTDLAKLLIQIGRAWRGESHLFLTPDTVREMLTPQNGGPYGLGAAVSGDGGDLVLMKRGQNIGYQGYLILYPARRPGHRGDDQFRQRLEARRGADCPRRHGLWLAAVAAARRLNCVPPSLPSQSIHYIRRTSRRAEGGPGRKSMPACFRAGLIAALFVFVAAPLTPAFPAEKTFQSADLDDAAIKLEADLKDEAGTVEKPVITPQEGRRRRAQRQAISKRRRHLYADRERGAERRAGLAPARPISG